MTEKSAKLVLDFPNEVVGIGFAKLVNEFNEEIRNLLRVETRTNRIKDATNVTVDTDKLFLEYVPKFDEILGFRGIEVCDPEIFRNAYASYKDKKLSINLDSTGNIERFIDEFIFILSSDGVRVHERSVH